MTRNTAAEESNAGEPWSVARGCLPMHDSIGYPGRRVKNDHTEDGAYDCRREESVSLHQRTGLKYNVSKPRVLAGKTADKVLPNGRT